MNSQLQENSAKSSTAIELIDDQLEQQLKERQHALGAITWLMMNSPLHCHYRIQALSERIIPSILHNQFRIYEQNGRPIGFVNWAWLSDEIEQKYQTDQYALEFTEWTSGENLWFPEFIAPFGHAKYIFRDLRSSLFPTQLVKGIKINPDGTMRGVIQYKSGRKSTISSSSV